MDIANQDEKVGLFVTKDSFVTVVEKEAGAAVTAVVVLSAPSQKLPHDGGDAMRAALKKEVDVVVNEDPGVDKTAAFADVLAELTKESNLVLVVFEDDSSVDPVDHDVI